MHNSHRTHIRYLLATAVVAIVALTACDIEKEREVCNYNLQLRYDYNEENTTAENRIEYYIHRIDEYIFDEQGILFLHRSFEPDACSEYMNAEHTLPPGRYSVIAIGNRDHRSNIWDELHQAAPTEGVTHRNDMRMALHNADPMPDNTRGPCERLYHGYRTFTVKEKGISRVRVDMVNAHLQLKFRITWRSGTPSKTENYYALLESVPSEYKLMPEWIYPANEISCQQHNPDKHDEYPSQSNQVIHHIPHTCYQGHNVWRHRHNTVINADSEMWGEFITYRIQMTTRPVLRIKRATDDVQIIKDINLQAYFEWYNHHLDQELKQVYELNIVVDGDQLEISPIDVVDWDEGGVIG